MNDMPGACQSRAVTEPQRDAGGEAAYGVAGVERVPLGKRQGNVKKTSVIPRPVRTPVVGIRIPYTTQIE